MNGIAHQIYMFKAKGGEPWYGAGACFQPDVVRRKGSIGRGAGEEEIIRLSVSIRHLALKLMCLV